MRVIVTRPHRDAQAWLPTLKQAGLEPLALPLIEICPVADTRPVQDAWRRLGAYTGVMFVSSNAVDGFFAASPDAASGWSLSTRAWATGPGTRAALLRVGLAASQIDSPMSGQFDSEALWAVMHEQLGPGSQVLIVRGADSQRATQPQGLGRDWFAAQAEGRGAWVDFVVAYERRTPRWNALQRSQAQSAASDGSVWLFSSSEAVANLRTCLPGQDWRQARAIATHARIAVAARSAGFGVVCESRPVLSDLLASIESLR